MSNKKIVNSWNEWDPLKHVIVGRADGCCIPAPEPALDAKVPEDSDMKGQYGPRTKELISSKNISRKECILLPFNALKKGLTNGN